MPNMAIRPYITKSLPRALALMLVIMSDRGAAKGLSAQLVLSFPTKRPFFYEYLASENALQLELGKTSPAELDALEHYDERLVRRVLIKDLGPAGCQVRLVLRDRRVRVVVHELNEPFRVALDLFDADYQEEKDPQTGLPLVGTAASLADAAADSADLPPQLVAHEGTLSAASSPGAGAAGAAAGKRLLIQAPSAPIHSAEDLTSAVREATEGIGKAWASFPRYIYRLQAAPYEAGMSLERSGEMPSATAAVGSAAAMADYGGKLFNLGHEARALIAYQQVLHRDPSIFERDALALWKFAEAHLGQGNFTLARGYYQAITEKHPESPLANFARLRILDVAAIRLVLQGRSEELGQLLPALDRIPVKAGAELPALVAIRRAYWATAAQKLPETALPPIDAATRASLAASYPSLEGFNRTAFLSASLVLADMVRPEAPWQRASGQFADAYFKRFSGTFTEPWRQSLREALHARLSANLRDKVADGKLLEAIDDYEALPKSLTSIDKDPANAWALAEAYRRLDQPERASALYGAAARGKEAGPERFKAQFWLAVSASDQTNSLRAQRAAQGTIERARRESQTADRAAEASWNALRPDEKKTLAIAYKEAFEKTISQPSRLRTPALIVLSSWTEALATRATATSGNDPSDWQRAFSPSGSAVILLSDLAKRFGELGMTAERRKAAELLRSVKPSELENDKAAKEIWAKQLVDLAEDYRKANQYLDAGRIYALVGSEAENFEGRAETLYKGGLLLYRAGRREEAVAAFRKAEADGNNLFYANLARERLSQID